MQEIIGYSPDELQRSQLEIQEIIALTPIESRAERMQLGPVMAQRYSELKQRLTQASGCAVACLTLQHHNTAREEFYRRLDTGGTFPVNVLFQVADLTYWGANTKRDRRLYDRITGGITRCAPSASLVEVVQVVERYIHSSLDLNTNLLEVVLSCRDDADVVTEGVIDRIKGKFVVPISEDYQQELRRNLEAKQVRAAEIRQNRKSVTQ